MATNSSISVTEGSGKNIASYSISESTTKELQRLVNNDSTGAELFTTSNPAQMTLANGTIVPGTGATNLGKAEDAAAVSGDTGVMTLTVRRDGAVTSSPTSASGDYQELTTDNYGQVRIAAQARTTNPTAAADGNGVVLMTDKLGRTVVVVGHVRDMKADAALTLTSTTTETTLIAAIASTFNDVYGMIVTNISATACEVIFRDVTAGTARFSINVPAGETRGFMLPSSDAYKQATVNTAWTAQCVTSVASIKINALYVKNI